MAIIKHKAYRSSNYRNITDYLELEHDAKGKVIKDENGNPVRRKDILMDGINCEPLSFVAECQAVNRKYNKNNTPDEVKTHGYIISFDPRDVTENGLTKEQVQEFGLEFAKKYLPGYQTLVYTHTDGHNGSGNLHCHIIINSIRLHDVQRESYMDQPMDNREGAKHRCTDAFEKFIKAGVMEMCREKNLYQTDLLAPAGVRITDKEYFLKTHVDRIEGKDFQTRKDYIREAVEKCAACCNTDYDFKQMMKFKFQIDVKESRGRYSYVISGRERGITDRQLGAYYTKDFIAKVIAREAAFVHENRKSGYKSDRFISPSVRKLIDIALNEKAQGSRGYEHALVIANVKIKAETLKLLSEQGVGTLDELEKTISKLNGAIAKNSSDIKNAGDGVSKDALYEDRNKMKKDLRDLQNARHNLMQMLGREMEKVNEMQLAGDGDLEFCNTENEEQEI